MPERSTTGRKGQRVFVAFVVAVLVGLALAWAQPKVEGFLLVDGCLDRGGSFNYELCECDLAVGHPRLENHQCW